MPKLINLIILAATLFGPGLATHDHAPGLHAMQATPSSAQAVVASEVLGRATPAAVENPELALGRVTIMSGAAIPVHYHAGTQIGVVVQGELTYSVFSGDVTWYRGDAPTAPETIEPGETVVVRVGDALVESPGSIHQGRNDGDAPLVIYLSTLFPAGAPRDPRRRDARSVARQGP